MSLDKYKYSLLASCGAECETPDGIKTMRSYDHGRVRVDGKYLSMTYSYDKITPIMRSIDQMTEEEEQAFHEFLEVGHLNRKVGIQDNQLIGVGVTAQDMMDVITWLLKIKVWCCGKDFIDGNIKQKEITEKV